MDEMVKQMVKYEFSEVEKKEISGGLAQSIMDLDALKSQLKSVQAQYKAEMTEIEARLVKDSEKIRSGYEMREMECRVDKDYGLKRIFIIRPDTGEMVKERPMSAEEQQMGFDLKQGEA